MRCSTCYGCQCGIVRAQVGTAAKRAHVRMNDVTQVTEGRIITEVAPTALHAAAAEDRARLQPLLRRYGRTHHGHHVRHDAVRSCLIHRARRRLLRSSAHLATEVVAGTGEEGGGGRSQARAGAARPPALLAFASSPPLRTPSPLPSSAILGSACGLEYDAAAGGAPSQEEEALF